MAYHENELVGKRVSFTKYRQDELCKQNCIAMHHNIIGCIVDVCDPNEDYEVYYQIETENSEILYALDQDCTFM